MVLAHVRLKRLIQKLSRAGIKGKHRKNALFSDSSSRSGSAGPENAS
jgi:hypothetical protein